MNQIVQTKGPEECFLNPVAGNLTCIKSKYLLVDVLSYHMVHGLPHPQAMSSCQESRGYRGLSLSARPGLGDRTLSEKKIANSRGGW